MRYRATFQPEAWQNDYAIPVDPEGPTEWDCTAFITNPPDWLPPLLDSVRLGISRRCYWLDRDDVLMNDPAAPQWVRDWRGPFTITVEESADVTA